MRWLLDLDVIPADAEGLRFTWEHPWPAWSWALLVIVVGAYAAWSYRRLAGHRIARSTLAAFRFTTIVLALVLISGPAIELPRESIEQDWVLMLVDRSESLAIADAPGRAGRISRDEQLRNLIGRHESVWSGLGEEREVVWLGFDQGAFDLETSVADDPSGTTWSIDLGEADGAQTRLESSIRQALQRAAARPVSGIVVFSDGRTGDPPKRDLLRRLQSEAIPVFSVALGSPDPVGDLAIRRVDSPRRAFIRDKVPIVVEIDRLGSVRQSGPVRLVLIDELTGDELDSIALEPGDERDRVTLTAAPQLAGEVTWRVEVQTDEPDLIPENNIKTMTVELVDRPLRVLFVEGYPRWEYRYLKNLLVREKSIESSVMLISADRDFAQEGNLPITRIPRSPEEFAEFDVIMLGDVPGTFFSPGQLDMIRDQVAERGAGLLWIAGERWMPDTYAGTVLTDLLPMRGSLSLPIINEGVNMVPTPLAEQHGVLQLITRGRAGWPEELRNPAYGWSRLAWAQRIDERRLKPAVEVLAQTLQLIDGDPMPLVLHMRFGAGQSIYVATDEIWRWRYGRGELLPEQFWVQIIRMLGRETLAGAEVEAVLDVRPRRVELGQPVRIDLRLLDAEYLDSRRTSVEAVIESLDGAKSGEIELRRLGESEARFAATIIADSVGAMRVRVADPTLEALRSEATFDVFAPDDELRRPESDHGLLATLASSTGGSVLDGGDLNRISELLPNRSVRTLNPLMERIWDTPLFFSLIVLLLAAEWVGRKIVRLI